jgi:acetyl esterase
MLVPGRTKRRSSARRADRRTVRDRVAFRGARALSALPPRAQVLLSGGRAVSVDGDTLHPEIQLILTMRRRLRAVSWVDLTPEQARRVARREGLAFAGRPTPVASVRDLTIPGPDGPIAVRHYAPPERGGPHPVLVYLHGGGFVIGDLDVYDEPCRLLCLHGGVHVLSVDYRLAPEHPFPAAVEDATAAYEWACAHAAQLGADPGRVAVGGDSAGGNLAGVIARDATDRPVMQLLIYPAADLDADHPSMELFAEGFFLTRAERDWYHGHYIGPEPVDDPRAAPLAGDLRGAPPALVVTAAFDPLRDEGEKYAAALRDAGTDVLLRRVPGFIHGFVNMTGVSPACRAAVVELAGALRVMVRA